MDRRTFLVNAAAATAATAGPFKAVAEESKKPNRKQKHRVAVIGCGRMGQYFAEVFKRLPDTELKAIAEWNDERRSIVGKRFGVRALFKDVNATAVTSVPFTSATSSDMSNTSSSRPKPGRASGHTGTKTRFSPLRENPSAVPSSHTA